MLPGITSESIDQVISQEPAEAVLSTLNDSDNEEEMHEEESLQNKHVPHQAHDAKVGQVMMEPNRPLCQNDYAVKEKMTIVNRVAAEQGSQQNICRFIDYAPMVFRKLREVWGVSAEDYMLSVGPQQILRSDRVMV